MSDKSLEDILIEIPTGRLSLLGYDIGPMHRRRMPNKANFDFEEIEGREWSHALEQFVSKHRIIDKTGNRYFELVVDDESGEILMSCDEPLSDHTDRGSAKNSNATIK